jgi:hypothetical protein
MYAPFLDLPVPALSKEQTMERFMETMLEMQRKQADFTYSVALAQLHGRPIPMQASLKQHETLLKLAEKAEALKGAYAKR